MASAVLSDGKDRDDSDQVKTTLCGPIIEDSERPGWDGGKALYRASACLSRSVRKSFLILGWTAQSDSMSALSSCFTVIGGSPGGI